MVAVGQELHLLEAELIAYCRERLSRIKCPRSVAFRDELPRHPAYQIAVAMHTATEVGGDYYDFRETADGGLVVAVGDATGHGAAAGTLVTVAKSLFTSARDLAPAPFLERGSSVIRTMNLGRL